MSLIKLPRPFEDTIILINTDAETMALFVNNLAPVQAILVLLNCEVLHEFQLLEIKEVCEHLVVSR